LISRISPYRFAHHVTRVAAALAVGATSLLGIAAAPAPAQEDTYIVVLKDRQDSNSVAQAHARDHAAKVKHVFKYALNGYSARIPADRLARIKADPRVEFVSENRSVSTTAQQAPTGLQRIGGSTDRVSQTLANDGTGITVAVIDTGIDLAHPDLGGTTSGVNCVTSGSPAQDDNGHGTHVAGTIAARDANGLGIAGVAPSANLVAVKVLDAAGGGTWESVICGVEYVTANASTIKVANLSLGGGGSATPSDGNCLNTNNDALHTAICNSVKAGVTYAVAAGNSGVNAANSVPAAYAEVITVSAWSDGDGTSKKGFAPTCRTGERDEAWASFTNYGAVVDIAAPGVCINSTWLNGGYNTISGTSMAAPHVAGAAALYLAKNPVASPASVKSALLSSASALRNDGRHTEDLLNIAGF